MSPFSPWQGPDRLARLRSWIAALDGLLARRALDVPALLRLCLSIYQVGEKSPVRRQAELAHASVKRLVPENASPILHRAARRELETLRLQMQQALRPPFGRFDAGSSFTKERRILHLPATGHLSAADVNAAYRVVANITHPDHGGSTERFRAVVDARDALIRALSRDSGVD